MPRVSLAASFPPYSVEKALKRLGANIAYARKRRGMTQDGLAQKAGITKVTLRRVERGGATASIATYFTVLWALGLEREIANIGAAERDEEGRTLERARMPQRVRSTAIKGKLDDNF